MNSWVNRWLGFEIYFVHVGHGLLFALVIAIVDLNVPWWAVLIGLPIILGSIVGWVAEATLVLPAANRLLNGEAVAFGRQAGPAGTTTPPGEDAARRDGPSTQDPHTKR